MRSDPFYDIRYDYYSVKFDEQLRVYTVTQNKMSSFLRVVDPALPCEDMPTNLACEFKYPLDPFQQHAVKAIHNGDNVLVTAKTGSGKTLVGEYLIHHCLKKNQRVFYTTPIKSLSNQKFHDLKAMFPSVGIMTGDIKYRPDAQILIMTTEILRNLLYKRGSATASLGLTASISLENLGGVVFDEVHYINDRERGKVWEETMILLDRCVQQVLLSATIDRPDLFASWLGDLKQTPIHLISTTYRIVPLEHQIFLGKYPRVIMDNKEIFYDGVYKEWLDWRHQKIKAKEQHDRQVGARRQGGYQDPVVKSEGVGLPAFPHQLNECVRYLHTHQLLPAIFFVFSRKSCERFAHTVEGSLIDSSDSAAIDKIWNFHLHKYKDVLEHLPQAHSLLGLVKRGIAYHHSGILPILREMIEILFGKGLIKLLFATETFAVGINMPTKSVVFLDLKKFTDENQGLRLLRTDEYTQMAGRAGRRGKDTIGHVFYLPQRDPVELSEMKFMLTGKKSAITSRMDFDYDFILKTLHSGNKRWMDIISKSYWYQQREAEKAGICLEILNIQRKIQESGLTDVYREGCAQRILLEERVKNSVNAARKTAQREYDSLKNKQLGPAWAKAETLYKQVVAWEGELYILEAQHKELEEIGEGMLVPNLNLLHQWGFLEGEDHKLTKLGVLATEINEGHPILMSKAFLAKVCEAFEHADIAAFLAAFMNEGKENDSAPLLNALCIPQELKDALWSIDETATQCQADEDKVSPNRVAGFWNLQITWIEPVYRWVQGEEAAVICRDYDIYEGNLMRSLLKIANMVEEWTNCAVFCQDTVMLATLEGLKEKIVRGLARPESLYLTL
jgi:superfamily II RNA helicase